jgi:hypothetical protein
MELNKTLESCRVKEGAFASPEGAEWGLFLVPLSALGLGQAYSVEQWWVRCLVDDGRASQDHPGAEATGWEHVSVSVRERHSGDYRMPSWDVMARVKDLFFSPHETVVQYHPAKADYVNQHGSVLHLWRPVDGELPTPPPECVGTPNASQAPGTEPTRPASAPEADVESSMD